MERRRRTDRLVGALLGALGMMLLLVVGAVALVWWLTVPAGGTPPAATPTGRAAPGSGATDAPTDAPTDLAAGETWLGDLVLGAGLVLTPEALLRDVSAVGQDVRSGPDGLVAGALQVEATVPFEVVEAELKPGDRVRADGAQAAVERTVVLGGRELDVVASGAVEVVEGRIVVEPRTVDVGGPDALSEALGGLARGLVTIEHEVEGLPEGLVLQDVTVREDGFRAVLSGQDVRLDS